MNESEKTVLIKNVQFFDPCTKTKSTISILISNGIITDITHSASQSADRVVDLKGACVCPAFVDLDCSICDTKSTHREDVVTGTRAAIGGGYAALLCTQDRLDSSDGVTFADFVKSRAKSRGFCEVFPVVRASASQSLEKLKNKGVLAISNEGASLSTEQLYNIMKECARLDMLFIGATEDESLTKIGVVGEGKASEFLNLPAIPAAAESVEVSRLIALAGATKCRVHLSCISTMESAETVRLAKQRGVSVTAATAPQYFSLTEEDIMFYGANAKLRPPLRSQDDANAIIKAIADGTVDAISSRHRPCSKSEKSGTLVEALPGMIGLQSVFSASYTYLVAQRHVDIYRLIELLSIAPARIAGLDLLGFGALKAGNPLSLCVFGTGRELILSHSNIQSKSFNTPYLGMSLLGTVDRIMLGTQDYILNSGI